MTQQVSAIQLEEIYVKIVDIIHGQTQDGGERYLLALNLACSILHQCSEHTQTFKDTLKVAKKKVDRESFLRLSFLLNVCNRFKQAEKTLEKKVGRKNE